MRVWGITDIGLKRRENQDTYAFDAFCLPDSAVAVVCDGMGGVNGGRLASSTAVSTFMEELRGNADADMTDERLRDAELYAVKQANLAVYARSLEDAAYRGMGTTLVSAIAFPDMAILCNVGDSRAYHIDGNGISRVTRDHSVVESLIESGDITPEQARTHPSRNLVTRALGPESTIKCDSFTIPFPKGTSLLLCSDGLIVTVEDHEILDIVHAESDGASVLSRLLKLALERGAPDNVTAVLIRNEEERQDG
ncbi:MAG: Stp1/IreP family PP2C-type Ser/Thr phosphatase [Ruminococcaceae bacterium]|jgi:protein phosphatase|nr:Stp1/IreP family PP2C-type Ser/Thr phosphatase [Oscillospiraceae bacterium]